MTQKREPMEMLKLSILIPNVYQQRKDDHWQRLHTQIFHDISNVQMIVDYAEESNNKWLN